MEGSAHGDALLDRIGWGLWAALAEIVVVRKGGVFWVGLGIWNGFLFSLEWMHGRGLSGCILSWVLRLMITRELM